MIRADRNTSATQTHFPAWHSSLFRQFWLATLAAIGATQLVFLGLGWLVFELTASPLDLGILGAVSSIPYVATAIFGGAIADRYDKRSILLATSATTVLLLVALGLLASLGWAKVWHVWTIAALIAVVSGIDWPTRHAYFPLLIEPEMMLSAVALNSFLWQGLRMAVPAFGGIVLLYLDTPALFFLAAAGFAVMYIIVWRMNYRVPGNDRSTAVAQILEGMRFVLGNELIRVLIVLAFAEMFFVAAYFQLLPAIAAGLGVGEIGYGFLISIAGAGAIVGTLITASLKPGARFGLVLIASAALSGTVVFLFVGAVVLENYMLALLTVAAASLFSSIFMVLAITVLQVETPDRLRGRVMGLHGISYSFMALGGLFVGAMADRIGIPAAITVSISLFLLLLTALTCRTRAVRGLDAGRYAAT